MRFLVAQPGPHFSVADLHNGFVEALRKAGQNVLEFPLDSVLTFYGSVLLPTQNEGQFKHALTGEQAAELAVDRLYASILKYRPHVLLIISAFFTPPQLIDIARAAGVRVVVIHTESPYEDERQLAIAEHAEFNFVNDPINLERFQALGHAEYLPHAYRPSVHHPGWAAPDLVSDLVFVGTGFPSRVEFFEAMDLDGVDVALAGNWRLLVEDESPLLKFVAHEIDDCLDNIDAARMYRASKMGINFYRREKRDEADTAAGWACGPREIEMAACGLPFLRDPRPESDELFPMLPTFSGPAEASQLLRWWLDHDSARETAAHKAREAIQDRTFDQHAARLLRLLERV